MDGRQKVSCKWEDQTFTTRILEDGRSRLAAPVPEMRARIRPEGSQTMAWKGLPGTEIVNRFPSSVHP